MPTAASLAQRRRPIASFAARHQTIGQHRELGVAALLRQDRGQLVGAGGHRVEQHEFDRLRRRAGLAAEAIAAVAVERELFAAQRGLRRAVGELELDQIVRLPLPNIDPLHLLRAADGDPRPSARQRLQAG